MRDLGARTAPSKISMYYSASLKVMSVCYTPQLASTGLFTHCVPVPCSLGCSSVGLYEVDSTKQTEVVVQIDSCSLDPSSCATCTELLEISTQLCSADPDHQCVSLHSNVFVLV